MTNKELASPLTKEQQGAIAAFEQKYGVTLGLDIASRLNLAPGLWSRSGEFESGVESAVKLHYREVQQKNPGLAEWYVDRIYVKAERGYKEIMGEKCDMNRFAPVSAAASVLFKEICRTDATPFGRQEYLPDKGSENPPPQLGEKFRAGLEAAAKTGKNKEELAGSENAQAVKNAYYSYVKSALYGELGLPEARMPSLPGDALYASDARVPKTVKDKVVLNTEERKNFESWLEGREDLGHTAWNKLKFAMGITDTWSRFSSGVKEDAQFNAYRNAMAEMGCGVLKLVYKTKEYAPLFMAFAETTR